MSEKASPPREFQPVPALEAEQMLAEGVKTFASTMIWSKEQKHVIHTHLVYVNDEKTQLFAFCPKDTNPKQLMAEVVPNEMFFSVSLLRANVFFKTRFLGDDQGGLKFQFPSKIFKVQRRKELRLPVREGYVLKLEYQDPLHDEKRVSRRALDLSAGGTAFLVPGDEQIVYQKGLILRNLTFVIRQKPIVTDARVCHISELKGTSQTENVKVGVEFVGLRESDSQQIASYVFEETRRFYSRFL